MSRLNQPRTFADVKTHGGAPAFPHLSPMQQLRRATLATMLWEDQFYESGVEIGERIAELAKQVTTEQLAALADEARHEHNLRHVSLLLLVELTKRGGKIVGNTIESVISRADELTEFLAIYWRNGKRPLSKQTKVGLARAFAKFDAYQLAKYNRDGMIKLRDVLFLVHAKPRDEQQAAVWKQLIDGTLPAPDTWEVALSGGADKRETFERLLRENKLGYLALLRNLRNMDQAGVDSGLVEGAILARRGAERVLPFRYVAAARAAPRYVRALDKALLAAIEAQEPLDGETIVLVDVSGSMGAQLSRKSDLTRMDAAATLAAMLPGRVRVFSFSDNFVEVPAFRGMAGVEAIARSQYNSGTKLAEAVAHANKLPHDRLIVITDEQSTSYRPVPDPVAKRAYMVNVASYRNGVGYGKWTHVDGFSERILGWIAEQERAQ